MAPRDWIDAIKRTWNELQPFERAIFVIAVLMLVGFAIGTIRGEPF